MQNEATKAITAIRGFLKQLPPCIALGSVVTAIEEDRIGVVVGIDAPEEIDQSWSYSVCWVKIGENIAKDDDDLETSVWDAEQLAVIPTEPTEPAIASITPESHPEIWPMLQPPDDKLKQFVQGISTFAWNADFRQFCEVCGFRYDNCEGSYARQKWEDFRMLQKGLNAFDLQKLSAIVQAGNQK